MIGLDIEVKNQYNNYLFKIFNGIEMSKYTWKIVYQDFIYSENGEKKTNIFSKDVLNGDDFLKCISRNSYYMIFCGIEVYPIGKEITDIKIFEDFIDSSCQMFFLCTDSGYIEFYCKDQNILDLVYNNCVGDEFEKVEYKTYDELLGRNIGDW